jgi:hypothetical protein
VDDNHPLNIVHVCTTFRCVRSLYWRWRWRWLWLRRVGECCRLRWSRLSEQIFRVAGEAVLQRPSFETPCFAWPLRMRSVGLNSTLCDLIGFMEPIH